LSTIFSKKKSGKVCQKKGRLIKGYLFQVLMLRAEVKVGLKKGVSDPEGNNILKALHLLGYDEVKKVRVARVTQLEIDVSEKKRAEKKIEEMCQRLLANPVIHDYTITISG